MFRFIRTTLKPACFHGRGKNPPFFEGWYYKLVDTRGRRLLAVIPGVYLAKSPEATHAFVQIFDGNSGEVWFQSFPLSEFHSADGLFDIRIGDNRFTAGYISLDIQRDDIQLHGELQFPNIIPWPVTLKSPGIMGWYAWAPFMQCYHGVVSLDHRIDGEIRLNGEIIDFSGGRGYIEKDWGPSFPSAWVWFQSNHFHRPGTSLTASVAIIPWIRGRSFPGFIIGLLHDGYLYRFATYTGARMERFVIDDATVTLVVRDRRHRLEMRVRRGETVGQLYAPSESGMNRRIPECLNSAVEVQLSAIKGTDAEVIFRETGRHAGMEAVGDLHFLVEMWKAIQKKDQNPRGGVTPVKKSDR